MTVVKITLKTVIFNRLSTDINYDKEIRTKFVESFVFSFIIFNSDIQFHPDLFIT